MKEILACYIIAVICNRLFNLCIWWMRHRKEGPLAYYREHGPMLLATGLLHVPLFMIWYAGMLLPIVNGVISAALAGADAIPGVDLSSIVLPTAVTPAVKLIYGWPIDSMTSRLGMWLGSTFAILGGNGAAAKESK